MRLPPVRRIRWKQAWRIIAARHPPIHLFERATPDPPSWDLLMAAEMLVNPRVQDEIGQIQLVLPAERVSGPGATWVMAAFTHLNPAGSRFSDGRYGVYYAGRTLGTAIAETVFHFERFARDADDPPRYESFRALLSAIDAPLHDLAGWDAAVLDPESYVASQALGRALREQDSLGVHYPSVRDPGGRCVGLFKPTATSLPTPERHVTYHWNGERVARLYDHLLERWVVRP
jgi:hypothetical protein